MRVLGLIVILFLTSGVNQAQGADSPKQAAVDFDYTHSFHGTFGIGVCQHGVANISGGGGAEAFLRAGLTAGGDVSYQQFVGESGYGLATANAGYHFVDRTEPVRSDPFVSGGVGAAFARGDSVVAGSVGGGLNYWLKPRIGLRTEGRVYLYESEAVFMFRIGLSFR
jgi:hypothetical protein